MDSSAASRFAPRDDDGRLLTRVRRVRALHGDTRPRHVGDAGVGRRTTSPKVWAGAAACWALCSILPFGVALHVRTAPAHATVRPARTPPLVRDALVRLLDVAPAARLTTVAGTAEVVAWSPDGRLLAAGYSGGALLLWDVARRRLAARVLGAHRRFVGALAWSPDGRLLATAAADGTAVVWRVGNASNTPSLVRVVTIRTAPRRVPAVAFAPRGGTLAVADGLRTVTLWDVAPMAAGGGRTATMGMGGMRSRRALRVPGRATALAWSPEGMLLAAGTAEGGVALWRGDDGRQEAARSLGSTVWALAWAPSGVTLAAGCADGAVRLLAGAGLRTEGTLVAPFHRAPVLQAPDYGAPAERRTTKAKAKAKAVGTPGLPRLAAGAAINGLAWSPDGDLLAVTATGVPLRLWRPLGGVVLVTYHPNWDQNAVAWRPDGTLAAVAMDDGSITLLRAAEPALPTETACRADLRGPCALLRRPLAPAGRYNSPPAFMGR